VLKYGGYFAAQFQRHILPGKKIDVLEPDVPHGRMLEEI
jgi:hypothetical protein